MIKCSWTVPIHKFKQFHEILCANGGRYTSNPFYGLETVWVDFEIECLNNFNTQWNRCNTEIKEIKSDQWYKCWFRRFKLFFR